MVRIAGSVTLEKLAYINLDLLFQHNDIIIVSSVDLANLMNPSQDSPLLLQSTHNVTVSARSSAEEVTGRVTAGESLRLVRGWSLISELQWMSLLFLLKNSKLFMNNQWMGLKNIVLCGPQRVISIPGDSLKCIN